MSKNNGINNSILELVGETPLIKLQKITKALKGSFFAKVEAFNPGLSSKDRIALHILNDAEKKGILKKGATIVETTSGNTGYSLAMISLVKGYKCILAVSDKSSKDKIDLLKTMGAEVHICPANVPADDPRSYYEVAKIIHRKTKNSVYINQYFNELNIEAHYNSTGPEIWKQTEGKITHLVACSGTGGTISGIARYLKEQSNKVTIIGIDAYGSVLKKYHETKEFDKGEIYPYRIEGLGKNLIPSATDFDQIDRFVKVTDEGSAHAAREIASNEGLFVGYTSGATIEGLKILNKEEVFDKDSVVVVVFPDHGSRYMSKVYSDKWMEQQGFFDNKKTDVSEINYVK